MNFLTMVLLSVGAAYLLVGGLLVGYTFLNRDFQPRPTVAQRIALGLGWFPWAFWVLLQKVRRGELPGV